MARLRKGVQIPLSWVPDENGHVPENAIEIAQDLFVGRAQHAGETIPGWICTRTGKCRVPWGSREYEHTEYDVLCETHLTGEDKGYEWVPDSDGSVPDNALIAGKASDGKNLYLIKAEFEGYLSVGKVHEGHPCGYVTCEGREHPITNYEVLVLTD